VLVVRRSWWTVFGAERCATTRTTGARCSRSSRSSAARSAPPTATSGPAACRRRRHATAPLPTGELFAHAVGYSYTPFGRAGLERYYNDQLIGRRTSWSASSTRSWRRRVGDDLQHDARRRAPAGRASTRSHGRKGAVVALDVKTGACW
jgi:peptidoglycan glycosyltransferase